MAIGLSSGADSINKVHEQREILLRLLPKTHILVPIMFFNDNAGPEFCRWESMREDNKLNTRLRAVRDKKLLCKTLVSKEEDNQPSAIVFC